jgi:hypothetical protein
MKRCKIWPEDDAYEAAAALESAISHVTRRDDGRDDGLSAAFGIHVDRYRCVQVGDAWCGPVLELTPPQARAVAARLLEEDEDLSVTGAFEAAYAWYDEHNCQPEDCEEAELEVRQSAYAALWYAIQP